MGTQTVRAGVDVSAAELQVSVENDRRREELVVSNDAAGHRSLIRRLKQLGTEIFVGLEATGTYGLDLAVALCDAGVQVTVINPRAMAQFAKALLQRSKTDRVDAAIILSYVQRMPFVRWVPPSKASMDLRTLARHIHSLKAQLVVEKNRLHAAEVVQSTPRIVISDLKRSIATLEKRAERFEDECLEVITADPELLRRFGLLVSSRGYGQTSAIRVLSELAVLAPDMSPRQWTAHAGLDPRQFESGTSVHKPDRISKAGNRYLRAALYFPAVTAIRCDPHVKAFADKLSARGKKPLQIHVAVMRKMLHSIHGMFRNNTAFDGAKFYSGTPAAPAAADAA